MVTTSADLPEYQNDHDILVMLRTEMRGLREDFRTMNENIVNRVNDHETRMRLLENSMTTSIAEKGASERLTRVGGIIIIFIVGVVEFILQHYWK